MFTFIVFIIWQDSVLGAFSIACGFFIIPDIVKECQNRFVGEIDGLLSKILENGSSDAICFRFCSEAAKRKTKSTLISSIDRDDKNDLKI